MFEPNHATLVPLNGTAGQYVVTIDKCGYVWLTVQNHQDIPAYLEAGIQLGSVSPKEVAALGDECVLEHMSISCNGPMNGLECTTERLKRLFEELTLPVDTLTLGEASQMKAL